MSPSAARVSATVTPKRKGTTAEQRWCAAHTTRSWRSTALASAGSTGPSSAHSRPRYREVGSADPGSGAAGRPERPGMGRSPALTLGAGLGCRSAGRSVDRSCPLRKSSGASAADRMA